MKRIPFKYKEIMDKIIKGSCVGFIILATMVFVLLSLFSCQKGQLTEKEQRTFKGCIEPRGITQEDALKILRVLVKGDSETIRWYREYEKDENRILIADRRSLYQDDICSMVRVLSKNKPMVQLLSGNRYMVQVFPKNKHIVQVLSKKENKKIEEGYNLILQVIEQKAEYPRARVCAIRATNLYGELRDGKWYGDKRSIPILKKVVNDKDSEVRLQAAGTLLSLGEGVIALPILDKLARAGIPQSTAALDKLFMPPYFLSPSPLVVKRGRGDFQTKLWDEKGKEILIKALNYSSDEVKAFAALKLADIGIEKKLIEDTAIKILERLKNKKRRDYKKTGQWRSDRAAGYHAVAVLEKVKSDAGINVLKVLIENNNDALLQKRAKRALENIRNYSPQKSQAPQR